MSSSPVGWVGTIPGESPGGEWSQEPPVPTPVPDPPRVLRGAKGDKGDQGVPGPMGGRLVKRARGPLSGSRVVRAVEDGYVDVASALIAADAGSIVGLTLQSAAAAEEQVEVAHAGELEDSAWSFVPAQPVFLGSDGALVQSVDSSWSYVCVIGVALSPTKLFVRIRPPIFRAG